VSAMGRIDTVADTLYECSYVKSVADGIAASWRLGKQVAGPWTTLDIESTTLTVGQTYELRLVMRGAQIACFVDGVQVVSATDSSVTGPGRVGFGFWGGSGIHVGAISAANLGRRRVRMRAAAHYLLETLGSDDFNRADGGLGANWTSGYTSRSNPAIVGNRVRGTATNIQNLATYNATTPSANQWSRITIPTFTESGGNINAAACSTRMNASGQPEGYSFTVLPAASWTGDPGNSHIGRHNSDGSSTTLTFEDVTPWAAGDTLWCISVGNTHSLWRTPAGTVLNLAFATKILQIDDATWATGRVGFYGYIANTLALTDLEIDDFTFGDVTW
jgi:hypothetical protein